MATTGTTYNVRTNAGAEYTVTADRIEVDASNSNRVTFFKGDDVVAQENDSSSVYPS